MDKEKLKKELLAQCQAKIAESIAVTSAALESSENSMFGETKSSAGDKFETSRAMLQAEQDRLKTILIKNKELEHQLSTLSLRSSDSVRAGSIVDANSISYFISVGLGKIKVGDRLYYAISVASPIGRLLMDKKVGDHFEFNGKTVNVVEVY